MTEARRDRWGRYQVVPPEGGKPLGYTRVTTVAKSADDGGGLIPWKATLAVVGTLRRPGILASWQALIAEHPDPWYGSQDSKGRCKKLVEQAAEAGGSTDRADIGTALHALIEQGAKTGWQANPILQPNMQADVEAYRRALDAAGIRVLPEYVESIVCLDEHQAAGTSDNLAIEVPGYGLLVGDLKTGTDLRYSWQAIAVQLAAYAHADNVYVQGEAADGSQDRRLPMPNVSKELGLVIHLPAGEARCELHLVDLVAGWDAWCMSMDIRRWRARKDLVRPLEVAAAPSTPAPAAGAPAPVGMPDFDAPAAIAAPAPAPVLAAVPAFDDVPPAPAPLASVEAAPAPVLDPADIATAVDARPAPDEGGPADDAAVEALSRRFAALPESVRKGWWATLATQAIHGHNGRGRVPYRLGEARTMRRFEITRALVTLAEHECFDDEVLRALVASVLVGEELVWWPTIGAGQVVGMLGATEAATFARHVDVYVATVVPGTIAESGRLSLDFAGLAA